MVDGSRNRETKLSTSVIAFLRLTAKPVLKGKVSLSRDSIHFGTHLSLLSLCLFQFHAGSRRPHFGILLLEEDTHKLELRSKTAEVKTAENEKTKKIIDLKGKKQLYYLE